MSFARGQVMNCKDMSTVLGMRLSGPGSALRTAQQQRINTNDLSHVAAGNSDNAAIEQSLGGSPCNDTGNGGGSSGSNGDSAADADNAIAAHT